MKKRIISLILVVAMAFLTLTGCAYNYAKDDMSKYAELNFDAFYQALVETGLTITDGDFGTDEDARKVKVQDAIAAAILKVTDTADKKFTGKLEAYDQLYFCYYAVDDMGNVFFASKMDETKVTNIQLGLSSLEGLNKLISEGALSLEDVKNNIYSTSGATTVGDKDVISVSYTKTWMEGDKEKSETVTNEYVELTPNVNKFHAALLGEQVGVTLDDITVEETAGEETKTYTYKDVKVDSIVKDNSTPTVADGDKVFVTYTMSFKAHYNEETKKYELPEGYLETNMDAEGNYKVTYTMALVTAEAAEELVLPELTKPAEDATEEEKAAYEAAKKEQDEQKQAYEDSKTLLNHLVGKTVGTTNTITVKNGKVGDQTVEIKYTGVKVNHIVNSEMNPFEVKYTPYEEKLNDEKTNKKTETSVTGEKVILNGEELTYYIFPVHYVSVEELSADLIVREFYSTLLSTQTKEHDHTEEEHEHETEYVIDTLNQNFKTTVDGKEKTIVDLVTELKTLYGSSSTADSLLGKEKALSDALKALQTAQKNLVDDKKTSESETLSLKEKVKNANETYVKALAAVKEYEGKIDAKVKDILACTDGDKDLKKSLVEEYETYQYDTLEAAYKADIKEKLAAKIIEHLEKNVKFTGELPKKAVKEAYNAIMNTYKYDFYEGNYSDSSSSSSSTATVTNYKKYEGDFNKYLLAKVGKSTMTEAKAAIMAQAEETVKDIIVIYVFAAAVEAKWSGAEVTLTKAEKKQIKKDLETTALLYQQYGLSFTYNVNDSYNAQQFDNAMNYLLEEKETEGNVVVYEHIKYTTEAADK